MTKETIKKLKQVRRIDTVPKKELSRDLIRAEQKIVGAARHIVLNAPIAPICVDFIYHMERPELTHCGIYYPNSSVSVRINEDELDKLDITFRVDPVACNQEEAIHYLKKMTYINKMNTD